MRILEGVANVLAKAPVAWVTSTDGPFVLLARHRVVRRYRPVAPDGVASAATARGAVHRVLAPRARARRAQRGAPSALTMRVLDIGQGDSIVLQSPAGATVLIDGGPDDELAARLLVSLGVKRLDAVVATHPHADHIAGLPQVLARFPVGVFYEPGCPDDTALQAALHEELDAEGIPVHDPRAGDTIQVGDLTLEVLSPDRCWNDSHSDPNNDSVVMLARRGDDTILLTGDAEREAQQVMLDAGRVTDIDVLKMPHHGGDTSLPELFPAAAAEVVVISCRAAEPLRAPRTLWPSRRRRWATPRSGVPTSTAR